MVVIVMGVAGAGKTTVGKRLAAELKWDFFDGDDYHTSIAVSKMTMNIGLTDADRRPWLDALHSLITDHTRHGGKAVVACSALKRSYRNRLRQGNAGVLFVYLRGGFDLMRHRLLNRKGHFVKAELLASQFEDLEEPENGLTVDASRPLEDIVSLLRDALVNGPLRGSEEDSRGNS